MAGKGGILAKRSWDGRGAEDNERKKKWKKFLTNEVDCVIMKLRSAERKGVPCKLNNVRRNRKISQAYANKHQKRGLLKLPKR